MSNFYQILMRSKKSIEKDMRYSESHAQLLYSLLKRFWENHPEANNSETFELFENLFMKINEDVVTLPSIKSNNIKYYICKYLIDNPDVLAVSYDKIIREEERDGAKKTFPETATYNVNILSAIRTLTIEGLVSLREAKADLSPSQVRIVKDYMKAPTKYQKQYREKDCSPAERKTLDTLLSYLEGDELTQLQRFLAEQEKLLYGELKSNYVESVLRVSENMDRLGLLERYCDRHNTFMRRMGLSGLSYRYEGDEKGDTSVKGFFQRTNIEKMDIYKLSMLNAFLINRYTKALEDINKTFFIVNELGLWSQIRTAVPSKDGKISIDIDEKSLEALYRKMNFLGVALEEVMNDYKGAYDEESKQNITMENGSTRSFVRVDVNDKIKELESELGVFYRQYFGEMLPESSNNFGADFDDYRILRNATLNTYRIKDFNMLSALFNLYQVKGLSKNWGVILEDRPIEDSNMILLSFDIEGFNMPIRLHIEKDMVMDFLKTNQETVKIPMYDGASDFTVFDKNVGTQILMPLFMKQKKALKEYNEKAPVGSPLKRFLNHIAFLKDDSRYPEHLKVDTVVKQGKKVCLRKGKPLRRFIDLETGEMFREEKDGSFTKLDPKERVK